ncbi:MAG: FmdB family transcriptional regulator [Chloroflexota bacterium]|nr:FmdB family transcriptional regulator [Chloroflexota bacterium]
MPRYDYQCTSCDHQFELVQSFKEAGSGSCPECAGEGRRVFHAVPVIYKGSGFYTTDYGRPKSPPSETKEKESSSASESKSSGSSNGSSSSDSKSESTPAAAETSA